MFIVQYVATPIGPDAPVLHSELVSGTCIEEAKDYANTHLPNAASKYGARGYRIMDQNNNRVAIGPEGFSDA
jgi:hypothetical protein